MPRGVPRPPTVWDFIKLALDQHNANRIRIQREQARRAPNPLDGEHRQPIVPCEKRVSRPWLKMSSATMQKRRAGCERQRPDLRGELR
jgi:hypothetical protein